LTASPKCELIEAFGQRRKCHCTPPSTRGTLNALSCGHWDRSPISPSAVRTGTWVRNPESAVTRALVDARQRNDSRRQLLDPPLRGVIPARHFSVEHLITLGEQRIAEAAGCFYEDGSAPAQHSVRLHRAHVHEKAYIALGLTGVLASEPLIRWSVPCRAPAPVRAAQ